MARRRRPQQQEPGEEDEVGEDESRPECWICYEPGTEANALYPGGCECRGTCGYAHLRCLVEVAASQSSGAQPRPNPAAAGLDWWVHCQTCRRPRSGPALLGLARIRRGLAQGRPPPDEGSALDAEVRAIVEEFLPRVRPAPARRSRGWLAVAGLCVAMLACIPAALSFLRAHPPEAALETARQAHDAAIDAALQGAKLLAVLALALADCAWIIWWGVVSHVLQPLFFASIEWGGLLGGGVFICLTLWILGPWVGGVGGAVVAWSMLAADNT